MHQESLEYNQNLHLDPGTKKLILGLIDSLLSVVPVEKRLEPETTQQNVAPAYDKDDYIREVLMDARKNAALLQDIIDPGELERYYIYLRDYREISGRMNELLSAINSYRDTAYQFSFRLAELLEEHMEMVSPSFKTSLRVNQKQINNQPRLRVV